MRMRWRVYIHEIPRRRHGLSVVYQFIGQMNSCIVVARDGEFFGFDHLSVHKIVCSFEFKHASHDMLEERPQRGCENSALYCSYQNVHIPEIACFT